MYTCKFCEIKPVEGWIYNSTWCSDCRKMKHYINLYQDRVIEILDNILSRTEDKQDNKIKEELKNEIENKENILQLRSKKIQK